MTPKVAYHNILRRLSQWSSASKTSSGSRRAYRTEFQRFLWGSIFLVGYFMLVFFRFSSDQGGSEDNNGGGIIVRFGVFFVALGAYFAPGWSSLVKMYTASGRRLAVEKQARMRKLERSLREHSDGDKDRPSSSAHHSRDHSHSTERGRDKSTSDSAHAKTDSSKRKQNTENTG